MSFTKEQRELRRATLGASEVAAVVGLHQYSNAHKVWLSKVMGVDFEGNEATALGQLLEEPIFNYFADTKTVPPIHNRKTFIGEEPWMSATPDGLYIDGIGLVEVKVVGPRSFGQWGPEGTDKIPMHYMCQVQWQMLVMKALYTDVVMSSGSLMQTYRVDRNEDAQALLLARCREFWFDHVVTGQLPMIDGSDSCAEALQHLYPVHQKEVLMASMEDEERAASYFEQKESLEKAKVSLEETVNSIKSAIGSNHGIDGCGWSVRWTKDVRGNRRFRMVKKEL